MSYVGMDAIERTQIDQIIAQSGHAVFGGCACLREDEVIVSYTCGRALKGKPELFVTSLRPELAAMLLNAACKEMDDRSVFDDRTVLHNVAHGYKAMLRTVPIVEANAQIVHKTRTYFGHDVEVMQVVLEDVNHLYPWNEGCADRLARAQSCLVDWTMQLEIQK